MVFDSPPHANWECPLYFLRKLYVEFVLGKKANYFDFRSFQGIGGGMPQQRLGERVDPRRPMHVQPLVVAPGPPIPAPVHHQALVSTLGSLSTLAGDLDQHASAIASGEHRDDDDDGGVFYGAGPSTALGVSRPVPHICTSCHQVCYGPDQATPSSGGCGDSGGSFGCISSFVEFLIVDHHLEDTATQV